MGRNSMKKPIKQNNFGGYGALVTYESTKRQSLKNELGLGDRDIPGSFKRLSSVTTMGFDKNENVKENKRDKNKDQKNILSNSESSIDESKAHLDENFVLANAAKS